MTDQQLLEQFQRMDEQFQVVLKAVDQSEFRTSQRITALEQKTESQIAKLELKIEHEVTQKIEALFDNYKLTHEKQWELERRMEKLERVVEELQSKTA